MSAKDIITKIKSIIYLTKCFIFGFQYPKSINKLNKIFKKNGFELYIVGGAVRDFLMKKMPKDFDLTTNALQEDIVRMLSENNIKYNEQGAQFGIVVAICKDGVFEIATFREDISEGRKPMVKTGVSIEEDSMRRDLTLGALYFDIDKKKIIDFVGGVKDIKNKKIRMVGNPVDRIREDKLRILRIGRFLARFDGELDTKTFEAIQKNNSLEGVSSERIWEEIVKTYSSAKNLDKFYTFCSSANLWYQMFPSLVFTPYFKRTKNLTVDMTLLLCNNNPTKLGETLTREFKIPLEVSKKVEFLINLKSNFKAEDVFAFYKSKERFDVTDKEILLFMEHSHCGTPELRRFVNYRPSVKAQVVIQELGIAVDTNGKPKSAKDGKLLGDTIRKMESELFQLNKY